MTTEAANPIGAYFRNVRLYLSRANWQDLFSKTFYNVQGHVKRGDKAFSRRHFWKAIQHYREVLMIDPTQKQVFINCGLAFKELDMNEDAKFCFQKSLDIQEDYFSLWQMSLLMMDRENFEEAEQYLSKAVTMNSSNKEMIYHFALLKLLLNDTEEALVWFRKSADAMPFDHKIYYFLGKTYEELGYDNEALYYFEKSKELKEMTSWY